MKEYFDILKKAAEGNLPDMIDESSDLSINAVRELIEAGCLTAIDSSTFEGTSYLRVRITLFGREYLNKLESKDSEKPVIMTDHKIRLFISHSSKDSIFVQSLIELLRFALNLSATQIRCTSVDGYRLPGGANTDQQLRLEVHEAGAFIGVISRNSIKSLYVVFELGARWGAGLPLIPLILPGIESNILTGPLAGINALNASSRSQIHQLISDLSGQLNIKSENPGVYDQYIENVLEIQTENVENVSIPPANTPSVWISKLEIAILELFAKSGNKLMELDDIAASIKENSTVTEYYIDRLLEKELIYDHISYDEPPIYELTKKGRAYLVEKQLV